MKIKHQKEHDNIVSCISEKPKQFLESLGINDESSEITIERQFEVYDKRKLDGHFDIIIKYERKINGQFDIYDDEDLPKFVRVNIIINVRMESASEQLREMKKIINQYKLNTSKFKIKDYFVVVSENDQYKSFFIDEDILFYKF